jgi:hypothetical protein
VLSQISDFFACVSIDVICVYRIHIYIFISIYIFIFISIYIYLFIVNDSTYNHIKDTKAIFMKLRYAEDRGGLG